jgi:hypothetical protein
MTADATGPTPRRTVDRDYHYLRERVIRCKTFAAATGDDRGRRMLTLLAERGRAVLAVIDDESGLHTYLQHLPYSRAITLLAELIRQASNAIRTLTRQQGDGLAQLRRSTATLWEEAEALTGRADELAAAAVQHPPRLRLDTVPGSRALSRRLINAHQLDQAADTIDLALTTAGQLPHPDPAVDTLAELAATLREQAGELRATDETSEDWWTGYFNNLRRGSEAAAERERAETDRLHAWARAQH